mmetsp:Transcript_21260/g.63347  ORF Transcript_21260/g.63347 Transcript_21260/m.63347 type:complete len:217 (+) Transcript_21260:248-898(+)
MLDVSPLLPLDRIHPVHKRQNVHHFGLASEHRLRLARRLEQVPHVVDRANVLWVILVQNALRRPAVDHAVATKRGGQQIFEEAHQKANRVVLLDELLGDTGHRKDLDRPQPKSIVLIIVAVVDSVVLLEEFDSKPQLGVGLQQQRRQHGVPEALAVTLRQLGPHLEDCAQWRCGRHPVGGCLGHQHHHRGVSKRWVHRRDVGEPREERREQKLLKH